MHFALIGTRGVPAHYGGFETAVEEIGKRLVQKGHRVTVFCRALKGEPRPSSYLGMRLVYEPAIRRSALETLSHTGFSVMSRTLSDADAAIVFNAANAPLLPVLRARGIPVATHVDGLEWKRAKWEGLGKHYYRMAEQMSVRWSDSLIADAAGIADYYTTEFGAETRQIAYGAPRLQNAGDHKITPLGLAEKAYHLVVARFEPENHVLELVRGYAASAAELPLVVVGSAPYSLEYVDAVHRAADGDERIRLLGSVWDQEQLDQLYAGALTYLHGHSVGGTNPSLLRAAGAGTYVIAWNVNFNREVLESHARYVDTVAGVAEAVEWAEANCSEVIAEGQALGQAIARYDWDVVAGEYERLLLDLAEGRVGYQPPAGTRASASPLKAGVVGGLLRLGRVPSLRSLPKKTNEKTVRR